MENNEFRKVDIKNRTCYSFDDIIKLEDFGFDNIFLDEESYERILIYNISYKSLIDATWSCIRFDEIDGFIRIYDGNRYMVLFGLEKWDFIYNRIRYFISQKVVSHMFFLTIMRKSKLILMILCL